MRSKFFPVLLLGALVAAWGAASAPAQPPATAARGVFSSLQAAWQGGDAAGISDHVGEGRVAIGLPEVTPVGGHFSRSQCFYILEAHFEAIEVQEFEFEHVQDAEPDGSVALALARRRFRKRGDGRVLRDRVLVALSREADRWVISEIRALR